LTSRPAGSGTGAPERVTFLFDPRSPWCYQTSRWARLVEARGQVELEWGVLSLEVVSLHDDEDPHVLEAEYGPALRTAVALRQRSGTEALGRFYAALGKLMWDSDPPEGFPADLVPAESMEAISRRALGEINEDPALVDQVLADPASWEAVLDEHRHWTKDLGAFGVPTLVFGAGEGPAVFGPVLRRLPDEQTALELWRRVSWLAHRGFVFELKRHRALSMRADLPAAVWRGALRVARMQAARALMTPGGPCEGASLEWSMAAVRRAAESVPPGDAPG
jgi:hypothetical protein